MGGGMEKGRGRVMEKQFEDNSKSLLETELHFFVAYEREGIIKLDSNNYIPSG
jgi:hypothetical protein